MFILYFIIENHNLMQVWVTLYNHNNGRGECTLIKAEVMTHYPHGPKCEYYTISLQF